MLMKDLNRIMNRYVSYFHVTDMNFQFVLADDMFECQKKYGFDDMKKKSLDEATARKNWKNVAACMKYPCKMSEPFTLIFKRPYLEQVSESELYRLVFHEMTHMCDYRDYARIHNIKSFEELFSDPNAVLFQQWSEYHAERRGYAAWMKHQYGVRLKYSEFRQAILEQETMHNMKIYSQQYTNTAAYGSTRQIYFTMHLISHLSILTQFMPEQMTTILESSPFNYKGIEWIKKMMYVFHQHPTIDEMDPHFKEIARIIAEGFAVSSEDRWKEIDPSYRIPVSNIKPMKLYE